MRARLSLRLAALASVQGTVLAGEQTWQGPSARNEAVFALLAGGEQVQVRKTGLVWALCIEGQLWNGETCVADVPPGREPGSGMKRSPGQQRAVDSTDPRSS
jgi:hypothetical protein